MTEKQVIVTWYTPKEKMPPENEIVVVTFSGRDKNRTFENTIGLAGWMNDGLGWLVSELSDQAEFVIQAWCDLDPYEVR